MEGEPLLWLQGSRYVAARLKGQDRYRLIPWEEQEPFSPTPGILLALKVRREGPLAPDEVPAPGKGWIPLALPPLPPTLPYLSALPWFFILLFWFQGAFRFKATLEVPLLGSLFSFLSFVVALLFTFVLLKVFAGALLKERLRGNTSPLGLFFGIPALDRAAYRVGVPGGTLFPPLLFALGAYLFGCGMEYPWLRGVASGATLYLLVELFPLRPGAGAWILEELAGVPDLLPHLNLNLVARFLPLPSRIRLEGGGERMGLAALALVAWFLLCGAVLDQLSQTPQGSALYNLLVMGAGAAGIVALGVWGIAYTGSLLKQAYRLARTRQLEEISPPPELQEEWLKDSALFYHVPELRNLPLRWYRVEPGHFLIRYGELDRNFYWIVDGRVEIVGRSPEGDPVVLAHLNGGCGVGEIAFLEARPRTADVIAVTETTVVEVPFEAFIRSSTPEMEERFREVVLASQSLSRSTLFRGIPPEHRERWIRYGTPQRFEPGEVLIEEGKEEQWMGIVVSGTVEVWRKGEKIAVLSPDDIFGEIAFLYRVPRTATLKARERVLIFRWEPEWLKEEAERRGLIPLFTEIARSRL